MNDIRNSFNKKSCTKSNNTPKAVIVEKEREKESNKEKEKEDREDKEDNEDKEEEKRN
jgi:hypothetical protein